MTDSAQLQGQDALVSVVIADTLGLVTWPDGEPMVRLARVRRERVANAILQSLNDAGYAVVRRA